MLNDGGRSIHLRLPLPSTLNRSVAASPKASVDLSTEADARNRPTPPLKPGSSGIGFTWTATGLVARRTTPPGSKKDMRWTPRLSVEAGMVSRPDLVG